MKLRCYLLSLLRIHHPNCEHYVARKRYGIEMRKRLEELGWRMQPCSQNNGNHKDRIELGVFDSEPAEVIALPVSWKAQKKTA